MDKRIVGALFCLTASILFSARYLAAEIQLTTLGYQGGTPLYEQVHNSVGGPLQICSILCLIIGIVYIIRGECDDYKNKK